MPKYRMDIDNSVSDEDLKRFSDNSRVLLIASSDFDFSRLPARTAAALETDAQTIKAPQLESITYIFAHRLTTLDAPNLRVVDTTKSFTPNLETSTAPAFPVPRARTKVGNLNLVSDIPSGALTAG